MPPRIRCQHCGAVPAHAFGPVIAMVRDPTPYQARWAELMAERAELIAELEQLDMAAAEREAVPVPRGKAKANR